MMPEFQPQPAGSGAATPQAQANELDGREFLRLIGLGAVIGIPAALVGAGFLALVHQMQHWLWTDLPQQIGVSAPPWYLVIGLPILGAVVVLIARTSLPGDGGHRPLLGLAKEVVPVKNAPGIALAAIGTLAFGIVLGPEGPLIALGSVAGVAIANLARVGEKEKAVLSNAGSFSAISALFGGPIVGGLLMVEAGLSMGTMLIPILLPGFVAAAIGYVLFVGLGHWGGLHMQGLTIPGLPDYVGTNIPDLLLAVAVGIVAAMVIVIVRRGALRIEKGGLKRFGMPSLLLGGALLIGVIAQIAIWLGATSQEILFSGQAAIPELVTAGSTGILIVLLVGKAAAYAVSLACGFRGGPIFPAIFLGIAVATFGVEWFDVSTTLVIAVGTAAGMVATTKLLLTPIVFAALLVGHNGVDAAPATVLAAVAAWVTATAIEKYFEKKVVGSGAAVDLSK
jgi:H+/Cl- antiporter ClcA